MDIGTVMERLGGVASRAALVAATSRVEVDRALATGELVVSGRGRYALPATDEAARIAHGLSGVLSLTSAALRHDWAVKTVPEKPHVTVPRNRKVSAERRAAVTLHRNDLLDEQVVDGIVTDKETTLTQCLRHLPFDEALCVADSALRAGEVACLRRVAASVRGPGAPRVRRLVQLARGDAANPFESVLRAIALDVPGLAVEPQVVISSARCWARPDLVDRDLCVVLEADSFEWHGDRAALQRDAKRYNLLVADGWLVLRFTWEDVMFRAEAVRAVLVDVVALVGRRTEPRCSTCPAA